MGVVFGALSDWLLANGYLTEPKAAKIFECIGLGAPALAAATMGYFTEDYRVCLAILTIGFGLRGGIYSGHIKGVLKLSPNFVGRYFVRGRICISTFLCCLYVSPALQQCLLPAPAILRLRARVEKGTKGTLSQHRQNPSV